MPRARNMDVDVVITNAPGGGVSFALDANGAGPAQQVTFNNNNRPGIMIYFNIRDDANSGLTFQPVPSNAMWVNFSPLGDPNPPICPTSAAVWNKFVPLSVEKDRDGNNTKLMVYFRNLHPQMFRFALRFLWPDGREEDYDPIGDGANGLRL